MIQSQFDAAAKLSGPKMQTCGSHSDDSGPDERPRKRRKTSPPIEDSIEVAPDTAALTKCNKSGTAETGQEEESKSDNKNIDGTPQSSSHWEDASPEAEVKPDMDIEAKAEEKDDADEAQDPGEEEVVLLSEESVLAGDLSFPDGQKDGDGGTGAGVGAPPGSPPDAPCEAESCKDKPHPAVQDAVPVASSRGPSRKSSRQSSPAAQKRESATTTTTVAIKPPGEVAAPLLSSTSESTHPQAADRAKCAAALSSDPSTPKPPESHPLQRTGYSSPLSSPPSNISETFDERSTELAPSSSRPSSPVSENDDGEDTQEDDEDDDSQQPLSQEHFKRSSTLRRSLSTLKGRELFDASIWADPLKTSVFYTFATNLRQKSRDAAPTGCHHFISHLSKAGKMVRCYTQNIDLLEDKVGLSTRLLLGPGSRGRFSTRASKGVAGTATPRNSGRNNTQLAPVPSVSCPVGIPGSSQHAVDDGSASPGEDVPANSQGAPVGLLEKVDVVHRRSSGGDRVVAQGRDERGRECGGEHEDGREQDGTTTSSQPVEADSTNPTSDKPLPKTDSGSTTPERDKGVECVYLHGSLRALRCFQCGCVADWDEGDRELQTMSGQQPPCPRCEGATVARQERGKRAIGVGKLRPDVVLYGEEHPDSQQISTIIQHDISLAPDMLIVMGTSLKVHGLKTVVREFAKSVHNRKDGKVIFVNYTKPADSVWADVFDFWIEMDCDAWVEDLKEKKPIMWLPPGSVEEEPKSTKRRRPAKDEAEKKDSKRPKKAEETDNAETKPTATTATNNKSTKPARPEKSKAQELPEGTKPVPKRPAAFRDCKQNGAYWTMKIVTDLAKTSGREMQPMAAFPPSTIVTASQAATVLAKGASKTQKFTTPAGPVDTRRGPRTKNVRSRAAMLAATTASEPAAKQSRPSCKPATSEPAAKEQQAQPVAPKPDAPPETVEATFVRLEDDDERAIDSSSIKREAVSDTAVQDDPVLVEVPVPNAGPMPVGEGNSILDAVKSNHRIRKPKAIFGEAIPSSDPPSRRETLVSNPKPKSRGVSQAKKGKASRVGQPTERQDSTQAQGASVDPQNDQRPFLPMPPLRPQPMPTRTDCSQPQTPDERIILAPLQTAIIGRRHSFMTTAHSGPPTPPSYLEPIVSPGPPANMSPEMSPILSPNHWKDRAFSYGDALARHFEGPRRYLDFNRLSSDAGPGFPAAEARLPAQSGLTPPQSLLVEPPPLYVGQAHPAVLDLSPRAPEESVPDDSPNRQLRLETEAAATLSQMSIYDNRQFAHI